jgi:GGDEF domain-containing protein
MAPGGDGDFVPAGEASGPGRSAPHLETMLRDGLDEMLAGDEEVAVRLRRLAAVWVELLGAEACAISLAENERAAGCEWIVEGPSAGLARGPDTVARLALAGVPQVYVKHDAAAGPGSAGPRRALAAFPLEVVRGVVWFLDLRLPGQEGDERLMILRRTARRLGRLLSLAGLVDQLRRDQAEARRMADLAARIAAATERSDVIATLREAIASELHPEFAVLRLPGAPEPEIVAALPAALEAEETALRAAEEDLAQSTRGALRSQVKVALKVADRRVDGLATPIRRGNECLGTLAVFRSVPASAAPGELWSEEERRLLERLGLHAAGALALAGAEAAPPSPGEDILDRRGLNALLRAEVRRSERYSVPFLLTVFEIEGAPDGDPPPDEVVAAFIRRFKSQLRAMDALARLGRTRFAVVNPHTDRGGGRMVLRARTVLGQVEKEFPATILDIRGNQIHFPADVSTFDELVARLG